MMMIKTLSRNKSTLSKATFSSSSNKILIETNELETLIKEQPEKLSILNATYSIANVCPKEEHIKSRVPTSLFYDFTDFSCHESQFSYTLPSE